MPCNVYTLVSGHGGIGVGIGIGVLTLSVVNAEILG